MTFGRNGTLRGNCGCRQAADRLQWHRRRRHKRFGTVRFGRPEEPARKQSRLQVGPEQTSRLVEYAHDPLGGQVAAAHGTFHRGRPAGIGPVTRKE